MEFVCERSLKLSGHVSLVPLSECQALLQEMQLFWPHNYANNTV